MKILTSMNRKIYDAYGLDSLERMGRFLPPNMGDHETVDLVLYWDGGDWPKNEVNYQIKWLDNVKGFLDFRDFAEIHQDEQGIDSRRNAFLWNARRFACKSFSWGDYLPDDDVIWLDADVKIFDHIPPAFLRSLITDRPYSYLGRDSYTETGFLAFNHRNPFSYSIRRLILECYRSHDVFKLQHWTDCHVFDHARRGVEGYNLSPAGKGFDHVFNDSVLGRYMDHCKGPRKKIGYSPENHTSAEERDGRDVPLNSPV